MAQWYVIRKGKEHGPFSDTQMREFAVEGKLKEHYQVRRSGDAATYPVADLEGLLTTAHATTPPNTVPRRRSWRKRLVLPVAILAASFIGLVTLGVVFAVKEGKKASEMLAKANTAWDAGDKQTALSMYRDLAKQGIAFIPPQDRAMVLGRAIDADAEGGNQQSLDSLVEIAIRRNIQPDVSSPKAKATLSATKAKKEASRQLGRTANTPAFRLCEDLEHHAENCQQVYVIVADSRGSCVPKVGTVFPDNSYLDTQTSKLPPKETTYFVVCRNGAEARLFRQKGGKAEELATLRVTQEFETANEKKAGMTPLVMTGVNSTRLNYGGVTLMTHNIKIVLYFGEEPHARIDDLYMLRVMGKSGDRPDYSDSFTRYSGMVSVLKSEQR